MVSVDVVYLCRNGENEELRYSIRSVVANLPHGRIWVFGGALPAWVTGVAHELTPQDSHKWNNTNRAVRAACEHPDVSDPFVLMNDDFYIMRPRQGVPALNMGTMATVIAGFKRRASNRSRYFRDMEDTAKVLAKAGIAHPLSYDLHVPLVIHKRHMLAALDLCADNGLRGAHKRSVYGNLAQLGGETIADVKVYDAVARIPRGPWLSSADHTFSLVRPRLEALFPNICRHELTGPPPECDASRLLGWRPRAKASVTATVQSRHEDQPEGGVTMGKDNERLVTVQERIYEVGEDGIRRLRFTPGSMAPADEVARLTGKRAAAPIAEPEQDAPPTDDLVEMNLEELIELAETLGTVDPAGKDADELRTAIRDARAQERDQDTPPAPEAPAGKPLGRMNLTELQAVCDAEGIDPNGANTRAEYREAIEKARAKE